MTTTPQNTFLHDVWDSIQVSINSATIVNQGDMLLTTGLGTANAMAVPASGGATASANFIGVADDTNPYTSIGGAAGAIPGYSGNTPGGQAVSFPFNIKCRRSGSFFFKTTVGESYYAFTPVYIGADAQTITVVAGSNTQVGNIDPTNFILGSPGGAPAAIVGAAGTTIGVIIKTNYP